MAGLLQAEPITIGFEGPPSQPANTHYAVAQYDESGFHFQPLGPLATSAPYRMGRVGPNTTGRPNNGSTHLALIYGDSCVVTRSGAGTFTVTSVDIAEYSTVVPDAKTVTFTGYKSGGATVTVSFTTDGVIDGTGSGVDFQTFTFPDTFSGLERVEFTDSATYDNMVLSADADVPVVVEPPPAPVLLWVSPVTLTVKVAGNTTPAGMGGNLVSAPQQVVLGNAQIIAAAVDRGDISAGSDWKLYVVYESEILDERPGTWVFELRNGFGKRVSLGGHLQLESLGQTRAFAQKAKSGKVGGSLTQNMFCRQTIDLGGDFGVVQAYGKLGIPYTLTGTADGVQALAKPKSASMSGYVDADTLIDVTMVFGKWHGEFDVLLPEG